MMNLLLFALLTIAVQGQTRIVVWKAERVLEIVDHDTLVASFRVCELQDVTMPKRREGDGRTPEGVYRIMRMSPPRASYKSIAIDYPNRSDRARGSTGGGIAIHGRCCSSGCIGMEDVQMDGIYRALARLGATAKNTVVDIRYSKNARRVEERLRLHPELAPAQPGASRRGD